MNLPCDGGFPQSGKTKGPGVELRLGERKRCQEPFKKDCGQSAKAANRQLQELWDLLEALL